MVTDAVSVASVQLNAGNAAPARKALTRARSSVMWTAVTIVAPATIGSSVKPEAPAKFAVQLRLADIVTAPSAQSASPLQPTNVDPAFGVAVRVTSAPLPNCAPQIDPHSIAAGELVIRPVPLPAFVTVSSGDAPPATSR